MKLIVEIVTLNMAVPLEVNVTEGLLVDAEKPVYGAEAVRLTLFANLFKLVIVMVVKFVDPDIMVRKNDAGTRRKPGWGTITLTSTRWLIVALAAFTRTG